MLSAVGPEPGWERAPGERLWRPTRVRRGGRAPRPLLRAAAPTVAQTGVQDANPLSSVSNALSTTTGAGNCILALFGWNDATSTMGAPGDGHNTYTHVAGFPVQGNGCTVDAWIAKSIVSTGGGVTITATPSGSLTFGECFALEIAGADATTPIPAGGTNGQTGASGSPTNSGNITLSVSPCLLIGYLNTPGNGTNPGTGYSHVTNSPTSFAYICESMTTSGTGTFNATTATDGGAWAQLVIAFQPPVASSFHTDPMTYVRR